MNPAVQALKSRLKGTWIHHAVWAYKNPPLQMPREDGGDAAYAAYRNANYNRQTMQVMFRVLRRNSNCIDVGAHVGDILRYMAAISPHGNHYAFEPLPQLSQELRKRFPQAHVCQAAVSDISGESEFQFVENDPGYSGLRFREYDRPDPRITPIRVRVVTLDASIPRDQKIAFIKLDIEGAEFHALRGGIETIRRGRPVIVFEASSRSTGLYGVKPDDFYSFVTETLGYHLSTMERWLKRKGPFTQSEFGENWYDGPEYYFIATPNKDKLGKQTC